MLTLFNCQSAICGLHLSHTNNITTNNSFRLISSTRCQICLSVADIFTITELFLECWSTGWEQWPRKVETIEMTWCWDIFLLLLFYILFYFILLFLVFPYLAKSIFQETSTKINTKNCQCYCKNKSTTILLSILLPTIEMKSKFSQLCSETTRLQLSFEHLFSCQ